MISTQKSLVPLILKLVVQSFYSSHMAECFQVYFSQILLQFHNTLQPVALTGIQMS